ncbi:MAG: FliI/YscN family ATPase [Hyphomicrobium sp.]
MSSGFKQHSNLSRLQTLASNALHSQAHAISGTVCSINTSFIAVAGVSKFVSIGDAVAIESNKGRILAEVASIGAGVVNVMPFTPSTEISLGASVEVLRGPLSVSPTSGWKGRVVNALGEPMDGLGRLTEGNVRIPLNRTAPPAMTRGRLGSHVVTGIKAIDLFTPICSGQRIGIFAGSGVGKSTLLAMLSKSTSFDTIVLGLVGERGREVREFLEDTLSESRSKVVAVVATSDDTPMMRRLAPCTATSVAEYFRSQGQNVLLVIDSITRYAHAIRELALAFQEPPVARGYPPSVFGALPQLLERAGPGDDGAGAITAFISVLVDGDDHNEPIADAVRGILDGQIVLDRSIAGQGRFPAMDPLKSISRLAPKIRNTNQSQFVSQLQDLISRFEDTRDLRAISGHHTGNDVNLDRAVELVPRLYELLKQDLNAPPVDDVYAFLAQALQAPRRL